MQRFILLFGLVCLLIIGCGVDDEQDNKIIASVQICVCSEDRNQYFCAETQEEVIMKKLEKLDEYLKNKQSNKGSISIIIKYVMTDGSNVVKKYENIKISEKVNEILNLIQELKPAEHPFILERKEKML